MRRSALGVGVFVAVGVIVACGSDDGVMPNDATDAAAEGGGATDGAATSHPVGDGAITADAADAGQDAPLGTPCTRALGAGAEHACVIDANGTPQCWGSNVYGQLGAGETAGFRAAVGPATSFPPLSAIALGHDETCGIGAGVGRVFCTRPGPADGGAAPVTELGAKFEAIANQWALRCMVRSDGAVFCDGNNESGQLGVGDKQPHAGPVQVKNLTDAVKVATTLSHACALTKTGDVWCWGDAYYGQCGVDPATDTTTPVKVPSVGGVTDLASPDGATCAILADKTVACWGLSAEGRLGTDATPDTTFTPVKVNGVSDARALTASERHVCTLRGDHSIWCWGAGTYGQLGVLPERRGFAGERWTSTAAQVPNGQDFVEVAAGDAFTCGLRTSGDVACWGRRDELGDGVMLDHPTPRPISALGTGVTEVALGGTYAFAKTGGAWNAWGYNTSAELATGDTVTLLAPTTNTAYASLVQISASDGHACAVTTLGGVVCWGVDESGELGQNDTNATPIFMTPTAHPLLPTGVLSVSTSPTHTCVVKADHSLACFGSNDSGQLGAATPARTTTPQTVTALGTTVEAAFAGASFTCALKSDHTMWCFGKNTGYQLGQANNANSTTPRQVLLGADIAAIAVGTTTACGIRTDGQLWCWGTGFEGEVGDGHNYGVQPSKILDNVAQVSLSSTHSCAVRTDGSAACWGDNAHGAIGTGNLPTSYGASAAFRGYFHYLTPTNVTALGTNVAHVSTGGGFSCATMKDGSLQCWGDGHAGQLGLNEPFFSVTPHGPAKIALCK